MLDHYLMLNTKIPMPNTLKNKVIKFVQENIDNKYK